MAEVLLEYRTLVVADAGVYRARAHGAPARDHTPRWVGWIEFLPLDGGPLLRTPRETTQPNRVCTVYWSTGLTPVYLRGALQRALERLPARAAGEAGRGSTAASTRRPDRLPPARQSAPPTGPEAHDDVELTPADRRFLKSVGIAP